MAKKVINVGTAENSKNGDPLRTAFVKINENFTDLYETVDLLSGNIDPNSILTVNLKGNVIASNGSILLNATTGKLALSAIPTNVPLLFKFKANFTIDGSLESLDELPIGWSYTRSGNVVTITHNVGKQPAIVSYWGHTLSSDDFRLRYPSAGYQVKILPTAGFPFSLNLNTAITGADEGEYALISVLF